MINPKWQRYIAASINKHFSDKLIALDNTYNVFIEGQHRNNVKFQKIIEIRFDGPYFRESTKDNWIGTIEINNLIQFKMDDADNYKIWDIIGNVSKVMTQPIEIFTYDTTGTPESLGCLQRMSDRDDITVHYFGQIEPDQKLQQATCEAHFLIELKGV